MLAPQWHAQMSLPSGASGQKGKGKKEYLYSAIYTTHSLKALRYGSHSFTWWRHS